MRRTEWLLSRPWLVVLVVAFLVVLPVLVLGEVSAADSRARFRTAQLDSLTKAADRAAASLTETIDSAGRQILAAAATPVSGKPTALLTALQAHDAVALDSFATYVEGVMSPQVSRIIVVDSSGRVAALEPLSDRTKIGDDLSARDSFTRVTSAAPLFYSAIYTTDNDCGCFTLSPPRRAVGVSAFVADARGTRAGVVVGELDVPLLGLAMTPLLSTADEIYLIDGNGRLILRATHAFGLDTAADQDLRASPAASAALAGARSAEADDPLGGGQRWIGMADVKTRGWHVLAVRSPAIVEGDLNASLDQARLARLALAAVILLGSVLFAATASRVVRQRRHLSESLTRNAQLMSDLEVTGTALAKANQHKSEFLANMSHELRTPLNAIIGFADVLGQRMFGDLNDRQASYTEDIRTSGQHLLTLINDILDLSKVEAGRMELSPSDFSLNAALSNGLTMIRERATSHRIGLDLATDGVDVINADERKVRQIIFNLLSNAVKFTPDGGTIAVASVRDDANVRVSVRDSGRGIAQEDRERIFEEFRQARGGTDQGSEGTGLGLSLTKALVELHHGSISVESEVGRGSTFTFWLPLRQPAVTTGG
ncbi:MAG TPA: sensor histidine kinase [Candidatus Limnocylindria bacterium]|jgi:signal transduction histidine kinase